MLELMNNPQQAQGFVRNMWPQELRSSLEFFQKCDNCVSGACSVAEHATNKISSAARNFKQLSEEHIFELSMIFTDIVPSILLDEHINMARWASSVLRLAHIFQVDKMLLSKVANVFISHWINFREVTDTRGVEAQSLVMTTSWLSFLGSLILGVLPNGFMIRRVSDSLRLFEVSHRLLNQTDFLAYVYSKLPTILQTWFEIQPNMDKDTVGPKLELIRSFIVDHVAKKKTFFNTREVKLFKEYGTWLDNEIISSATTDDLPRAYCTVIRDLKRDLENIKGLFMDEDFNPRPIEPFCIFLSGGAGVGKSQISTYIAAVINKATVQVPLSDLQYIKNPGEIYATGYRGQFCWVYDDFAQDQKGEDALELIKYITPQKSAVNMASMSDPAIGIKGTLNTSLLFICCSNQSHPVFNNILEQNAFLRRRHLVIEMSQGNNTNRGDALNACFQLKDPMRDIAISPLMNFKDILTLAIDKYTKHMSMQLRLGNEFSNFLQDFSLENLVMHNGRMVLKNQILIQAQSEELLNIFEESRNNIFKFEQDATFEAQSGIETFQDAQTESYAPVNSSRITEASTHIKLYMRSKYNEISMFFFDRPVFYSQLKHLCGYLIAAGAGFMLYKALTKKKMIKEVSEIKQEHRLTFDEALKKTHLISEGGGSSEFHNGLRKSRKIERNMTWARPKKSSAKFYEDYPDFFDADPEPEGKLVVQDQFGNVKYIDLNDYKNKTNKVQVRAEGCPDQVANDVVMTLSQQIIEIAIKHQDASGKLRIVKMHALPLKETIILAPRHLFVYRGEYVKQGKLEIFSSYSYPLIDFELENMRELLVDGKPSDLVLYQLKQRCRTFKDITSYFIDQSQLGQLHRIEGSLVSKNGGIARQAHTMDARLITSELSYDASGETLTLGEVIAYQLSTQKGDCGSVFVAYNTFLRGKILGMHVAGDVNTSVGFAKIITRDYLEDVLKTYSVQVVNSGIERVKKFVVQAEGSDWDIDLPFLGEALQPVHVPEVTKYTPSLVYERCGKHKSEPAILSPRDPRNVNNESPLMKAIEKCASRNLPIDSKMLKKIETGMKLFWKDLYLNKPKKLTVSEAINGIHGKEFVDNLNMASSAGWPYVTCGTNKKKVDHFIGEPGHFEIKPNSLLDKRFTERVAEAKAGKRIDSIWIETLKDETRNLQKIADVKTRSFSIAPLDFTLLTRQYTLDACGVLMRGRIKNGIAIGINPYSSEWTTLAHHLQETSTVMFDGDYEGYDRDLHAELIHMFFSILIEAYDYTGEDLVVMRVIENEIIHCIKLGRKYVFMTCKGNPSGNSLTAILNSFCNLCYIMYAFYSVMPPENANIMVFMQQVRCIVFGDDNVISPSAKVSKYFNFMTMKESLARIGIKYTIGSKLDVKGDAYWLNISEVTFLKNGFRKVGIEYYATLNLDTIEEMTNWVSKDLDRYTATEDNVNTALRYLYFHGYQTYAKYEKLWKQFVKVQFDHLHDHYICTRTMDMTNNHVIQIVAQGNTINHINNMQGWKRVVGNSLPTEITGDKLDMNTKVSGMDKPSFTVACPPTYLKDFQALSNANNVEYLQKMALNSNAQSVTETENTAEEEDEMAIKWLNRRWGYIKGVTEDTVWATDAIILDDYFLDPCYALENIGKTISNSVNASPMCVATMNSSFWRGSLEYKFIFLCDGFTTGKVNVDFNYGMYGNYSFPRIAAARNSSYSLIMDVNPHKYIFHVRVPYMHQNPWCAVRNFNKAITFVPSNWNVIQVSSMGIMKMSIVNPFVGPSGRCKVRLVILERAGEDFEVEGSFCNNLTICMEGDEQIVGNISSKYEILGLTADSKGTIIDTIGTTDTQQINSYGKTSLAMKSDNIDISHFLDRWQIVQKSALIDTTTLYKYFDIYELIRFNDNFREIMERYVYMRSRHIELRIEVNGNPYCSGCLVAAHIPMVSEPVVLDNAVKSHTIVGFQHGMANYNTTSAINIIAPYIFHSDYVPIHYHGISTTDEPVGPFGSLLLNFELGTLNKIAGASSPQYTIFARVVDPILKIPVRKENLAIVEAQGYEQTEVEMVTIGEYIPLPKSTTNCDRVTSLKEIAKKYAPLALFPNEDPNVHDTLYMAKSEFFVKNFIYDLSITAYDKVLNVGVHRMLQKMYGLYRGGIRLKMRFNTSVCETLDTTTIAATPMTTFQFAMKNVMPVNITVMNNPDINRTMIGAPEQTDLLRKYLLESNKMESPTTTATIEGTSTNGYMEFEVPYSGTTNWRPTTLVANSSNFVNLLFIFTNQNQIDIKVSCKCYIAGADDFRCKAFLGVGKLYLQDNTTYPQWPDNYLV
jgi:hypothetical protein